MDTQKGNSRAGRTDDRPRIPGQPMGWKKKDLILILRQAAFRRGLQALMRKNRFTCRDILSLAQATMSILSPEPEQGWLLFSYEYGKHTFYPENFPDVARPEYEKGYRFFMEFLHAMLDIEEQPKVFCRRCISLSPEKTR